jgi:hypothetical protein
MHNEKNPVTLIIRSLLRKTTNYKQETPIDGPELIVYIDAVFFGRPHRGAEIDQLTKWKTGTLPSAILFSREKLSFGGD